jgi:hypothetical protein
LQAWHALAFVALGAALKVPGEQSVHEGAFATAEKLPAGQPEQPPALT